MPGGTGRGDLLGFSFADSRKLDYGTCGGRIVPSDYSVKKGFGSATWRQRSCFPDTTGLPGFTHHRRFAGCVVGIAVANESLRESPYRLPNQAEEMDKDCGWRFGISHTDHAGERAGSCVA